jgi:uncharacterized RDD family membrane protein YckC
MSDSDLTYSPPFLDEPAAHEPVPAVPPPPPVVRVGLAAAPAVQYAGFWRRFWAVLLDAVILFAVGIPANLLTRSAAGLPLTPIWKDSSGATPFYNCLEALVGIIIGWIYAASLESSERQATVGKMAIGIRVTDLAGRRISFLRATGRHFAQIFDFLTLGIGYAMAGFTAKKQALHDKIAGTLVVKK